MKRLASGLIIIASVLGAHPAAAQVAWDSPFLLPPRAPNGVGLFLADVPGGNLGVLGMWRSSSYGFGLRAGIADAIDNNVAIYGGIDFAGSLTRSTEEFPLDIDWVGGIGMGVEHGALVSAPLGLTIGHQFEGNGVGFLPYLTPRVVLDGCLDCRDRNEDSDVNLVFAVDVGLDLRVTRKLIVRFGASLGDRDGVAIGFFF